MRKKRNFKEELKKWKTGGGRDRTGKGVRRGGRLTRKWEKKNDKHKEIKEGEGGEVEEEEEEERGRGRGKA